MEPLRQEPEAPSINATSRDLTAPTRLRLRKCQARVADVANVARAWTLAWAIMNDVDAPDEIPETFLQQYPGAGLLGRKLRDEPFVMAGRRKEEMRKEVGRVIASILEQVLRNL